MRKYLLELIVFACGAIVMVLEIVGSRVLAPYLGNSIVVWTSLIGVILGSLSLGYWWGGKIADKQPSYKQLAAIIFLAAVFIFITIISKVLFLAWLVWLDNLYISTVLAAVILFTPASILLGMVSPYAVRLKMKDIQSSGRTVGNLYAISTIGSIIGTFLAGFVLVARLSNNNILFILSASLFIVSLLAFLNSLLKLKILLSIFLAFGFSTNWVIAENLARAGFREFNTAYHHVRIFDYLDRGIGQKIRSLSTDPLGTQSAMFLEEGRQSELVATYIRFFNLLNFFKPNFKQTLMLGGAGYSFPKYYLTNFPRANMTVVEIDPQMTELAKKYFYLTDDPRLTIHHQDARIFLNRNKQKYDVVVSDAFNSFYSIPYHLTTQEAMREVYNSLTDDGVLLINLISAIKGGGAKFMQAEYATLQSVFPQVYLFVIDKSAKVDQLQNLMLVALKSTTKPIFISPDQELSKYLANLWTEDIAVGPPILTDDYAPVDNYMVAALR